MIKGIIKASAVTAMAVAMAAMASVAWSLTISSELVVADSTALTYNGKPLNIDGQICTYRAPGVNWIMGTYDKENYVETDYRNVNGHVFATGDMDGPFYDSSTSTSEVSFVANQDLFNHTISSDGVFWISATYQTADGILAIIHAEGVENTVPYPGVGRVSKTRVGLAWLANGASQFDFLGHMILQHSDPTNNKNIQGAPYLIKDGYMYIYYHDYHGISVSRAPLSTVVNNAKNGIHLSGSTSWFQKYYWHDNGNGTWSKQWGNALDPSLIGVTQLDVTYSPMFPDQPIMGSSHGDIIHSSTTGLYYMVTSGFGNHPYCAASGLYCGTSDPTDRGSFIRIFSSSDGLYWTYIDDIVDTVDADTEQGYQYVSLIGTNGYDNGECGSSFYIYSGKDQSIDVNDYSNQPNRKIVRFTVNL